MAAAILYGAYSFLGAPEESAPPPRQGRNLEALNAYVLGIAGSMPQLSLNDTEKYVMATAVARWPEDPFLRTRVPETQAAAEEEEQLPAEELNASYTGFVEMGGRRLAIINGREYAPGEELDLSGYVVRRIDPTKVELAIAGSGQTVIIPIEDMFFRPENPPSAGKKR